MSREIHVRFSESRAVRSRPATHLVVMCRSQEQAQAALARLRLLLAGLGLEPKAAKTPVVHLREGGPGFDFLGFHHRGSDLRSPAGDDVSLSWPAGPHARRRSTPGIGFVKSPVGLGCGCQSTTSCARSIPSCAAGSDISAMGTRPIPSTRSRLTRRNGCLFVGKRHKRGRRYGRAMLIASGHRLGLINLHGVVVAPRPNGAWRVTPNTAGEGRR